MTNQQHHINNVPRSIRIAGLAALIGVTGLVLADVASDGAAASPASENATQLADGTSQVRLLDASLDGTLVLDPLEVLSGKEAVRAALAAGEFVEGDNLPNDVYVHDLDDATVEMPTSAATTVWLYDCRSTCDLAEVPVGDVLAERIDYYGGSTPIVEVTVEDGVVSHIAEVYLP